MHLLDFNELFFSIILQTYTWTSTLLKNDIWVGWWFRYLLQLRSNLRFDRWELWSERFPRCRSSRLKRSLRVIVCRRCENIRETSDPLQLGWSTFEERCTPSNHKRSKRGNSNIFDPYLFVVDEVIGTVLFGSPLTLAREFWFYMLNIQIFSMICND